MINFTAGPLSGTLLKSAATTEEDLITKIILFGVDDQKVVQTFLLNPSSSGTPLTISRKVKSLYAIANPSDSIQSATPSTLADLMSLTDDFTTAPVSPFLMSGKEEIPIASASVNIKLVRAIAKIEIKVIDNDFVFESLTVQNTPDKGYVFSSNPLSIPTHKKVFYLPSTEKILYVPENSSQNPTTEFVVTGKFQGQQITHTFTLKKEKVGINIERNNCYQVDIGFDN